MVCWTFSASSPSPSTASSSCASTTRTKDYRKNFVEICSARSRRSMKRKACPGRPSTSRTRRPRSNSSRGRWEWWTCSTRTPRPGALAAYEAFVAVPSTRVHRTMPRARLDFFVEFEMLDAGGSELALVSKLKTLHDDNQRFFVPDKFSSNKFGVRHYAESVSYTVDGWCERNRDSLHNDLVRAS